MIRKYVDKLPFRLLNLVQMLKAERFLYIYIPRNLSQRKSKDKCRARLWLSSFWSLIELIEAVIYASIAKANFIDKGTRGGSGAINLDNMC